MRLLYLGSTDLPQTKARAIQIVHTCHALARAGVQHLVGELNHLLRTEPALHEIDFEGDGFEWIDASDRTHSIIAFLRKPRRGEPVLVVCNLTPQPRQNHCLGVPGGGT